MFSVGMYGFYVPRTINFAQYGVGIDLGNRVRIGRDDTNFVSFDGSSIHTARMNNVSTGISLRHSNFKFGLELPPGPNLAILMVSTLVPGSEIRLCNSPDPADLVGDGQRAILPVPNEFQDYEVVAATIPCGLAKYILIERGNVETSIHAATVYHASDESSLTKEFSHQ